MKRSADKPNKTTTRASGVRGSALLPILAAMLILLVTGITLSEQYAASTIQSVLSVESARAFWIAEAGLWHAAHEDTAIASPVTFDGGTYTVTQSGNDYTATGTHGEGVRVVGFTFTASGSAGPTEPLDEAVSEATAAWSSSKKFTIDLISDAADDREIESFSLSADVSMPDLKKLHFDGTKVWQEGSGVSMPTGTRNLTHGSAAARTVSAGGSVTALFEFRSNVSSGPAVYMLIVNFTDATTSTLVFTINW